MVKFSSRKDAIQAIKIQQCGEALLFLIKEQLDNAEADILQCNPSDSNMRDKLVKAQTFRLLMQTFGVDFK